MEKVKGNWVQVTVEEFLDDVAEDPTKDIRKLIVDTANSQLKVKEDKGPNEDKEGQIAYYWSLWEDNRVHPGIGLGDAWCAVFASAVYADSGAVIEGEGYIGLSYVPFMVKHAKEEGSFLNPSEVAKVKPGDLIFYSERGKGRPDHVGIVVGVNKNTLNTVEGNYKSGVNTRRVSKDKKQIVGFLSLD